MQCQEDKHGLTPYTIFAVQLEGDDGWRVGTRPVTRDLIHETLQEEWKTYERLIVICEHKTVIGLGDCFVTDLAGNKGWIYDWSSKTWRGPHEAISLPHGTPEDGELNISIDEIAHNKIYFKISSNRMNVDAFGDEFICDPLPSLVRLLCRLKAGKFGHAEAYHVFGGFFELHALDMVGTNKVRIIARKVNKDNNEFCIWMDVACDKDQVILELANFLRKVHEHPDFIHQYLGNHFHNNNEWEAAYELAHKSWKLAVDNGEIDKEDYDAEIALERKIIREKVTIPEEAMPYVKKYLNMLKTLEIPDGWS